MSDSKDSHIFKNDSGRKIVRIPVKEFVCIGETPPMDHPHVFLTMGNKDFMYCPYCSTRYEYGGNDET